MSDQPNDHLNRIAIDVCAGCLERRPGQCHAPGCVFWMHDLDQVPDLTGYYEVIGDKTPNGPPLTLAIRDGGEPADVWEMGEQIDAAAATFLPGWDVQQKVAEFHQAKGAAIAEPVGEWGDSRIDLLLEECQELADAIASGDPVAIMHESADVAYVAFGNAVALGYELSPVIAEIHRANMSKASDPNGKLAHKARKGAGYVPADVAEYMVPTADARAEQPGGVA